MLEPFSLMRVYKCKSTKIGNKSLYFAINSKKMCF